MKENLLIGRDTTFFRNIWLVCLFGLMTLRCKSLNLNCNNLILISYDNTLRKKRESQKIAWIRKKRDFIYIKNKY